jgi:hypothetical protein
MRSKAFISVLVALAMMVTFGFATSALADVLMFPWVVKSSTVSTVLSVVNTAGQPGSYEYQSQPFRLHYQYWYKETTENLQTDRCDSHSFKQPTSKDDIVTFDAAGNINGGNAMFNDPSPYNPAQSFQLNEPGPRRAFLLVDNNTPAFTNQFNWGAAAVNVDGTLYGEAMVLEIAGGAAWGYIAYNAENGSTTGQTAPVQFNDPLDPQGEVIGGGHGGIDAVLQPGAIATWGEVTQTVLLPTNMGTTRFFMTPVDDEITYTMIPVLCGPNAVADVAANQRQGNINARIQFVTQDITIAAVPDDYDFSGGIYNNDEDVLDFIRRKNIVCTSADDLEDLITGGAWTYLDTTGRQGWSYIATLVGTFDSDDVDLCPDNPTEDMVVGKLEFTTTGIDWDNDGVIDMSGTFNNFVWLRDNSSHNDDEGTNIIHNEPYDLNP